MEKFADCTKRGERSSTKLYNQEFFQGTRVCRNDYCVLFTSDIIFRKNFLQNLRSYSGAVLG